MRIKVYVWIILGDNMIKTIIVLTILLSSVGVMCAGEIVLNDNTSRVYIYGEIEDSVLFGFGQNFERTICENSTVIEGEIKINGFDNYDLEYNFICDINDTHYVSRILTIKQELISSTIFGGKVLNRTLSLDSVVIGNYQTDTTFWSKTKANTVYFILDDRTIRFGSDIIKNVPLAFTQLNYVDQYEYLNTTGTFPKQPIYHKYISVGADGGTRSLKLSGLTGIVYNTLGWIPKFGDSVQALSYMPLSIIQFTFNIIFSFLFVITNNWWYALMLIEIFCIMPALKKRNFADRVDKYIQVHVSIYKFMYETVILNVINLILRLIEIIRNMFRI